MFSAPVRSWVDAIDCTYFFAYLFHFYYNNSESEQNYTIYIFYQFTFFFNRWSTKKWTSAACGGGCTSAPVAPPFPTGLARHNSSLILSQTFHVYDLVFDTLNISILLQSVLLFHFIRDLCTSLKEATPLFQLVTWMVILHQLWRGASQLVSCLRGGCRVITAL